MRIQHGTVVSQGTHHQGEGRDAGPWVQVGADWLPAETYRMLTLRMKLALVLMPALAACTLPRFISNAWHALIAE